MTAAAGENVWPTHYRDGDGPLCTWSGEPSGLGGCCPNGCAGSLEHYENDGHPACATEGS